MKSSQKTTSGFAPNDCAGVPESILKDGGFQFEDTLIGPVVFEARIGSAWCEHHLDVTAHDPLHEVSFTPLLQASQRGNVVAVVPDLNSTGVEEIARVEKAVVGVVEGEAVFMCAGSGDDVERAATEIDGCCVVGP